MRIDSSYATQPTVETNSSPQPSTAAAGSAATRSPVDDQTQLSGAHAQAASLVTQTLQLPEVRQERVAALRQAVAGGSYRPASESVAHAMLSHMISGVAA